MPAVPAPCGCGILTTTICSLALGMRLPYHGSHEHVVSGYGPDRPGGAAGGASGRTEPVRRRVSAGDHRRAQSLSGQVAAAVAGADARHRHQPAFPVLGIRLVGTASRAGSPATRPTP